MCKLTQLALVAFLAALVCPQGNSSPIEDDGEGIQTRCMLASALAAKVASKLIFGTVPLQQQQQQQVFFLPPDYQIQYFDPNFQPINNNQNIVYEYEVFIGDDGVYYYLVPVINQFTGQLEYQYTPVPNELLGGLFRKIHKETKQPLTESIFVRLNKDPNEEKSDAPAATVAPPPPSFQETTTVQQRPVQQQVQIVQQRPAQEVQQVQIVQQRPAQEVQFVQQRPVQEVQMVPMRVPQQQGTMIRVPQQQVGRVQTMQAMPSRSVQMVGSQQMPANARVVMVSGTSPQQMFRRPS